MDNLDRGPSLETSRQATERIADLERQVRNANAAVVLSVDVIRDAVRRRSWALLEGFLGSDIEPEIRTIEKLERAVVVAAEAGIDSFLEYRDDHGYDEETAKAKALLEVGDGARAIQEIEEASRG